MVPCPGRVVARAVAAARVAPVQPGNGDQTPRLPVQKVAAGQMAEPEAAVRAAVAVAPARRASVGATAHPVRWDETAPHWTLRSPPYFLAFTPMRPSSTHRSQPRTKNVDKRSWTSSSTSTKPSPLPPWAAVAAMAVPAAQADAEVTAGTAVQVVRAGRPPSRLLLAPPATVEMAETVETAEAAHKVETAHPAHVAAMVAMADAVETGGGSVSPSTAPPASERGFSTP